MVLHRATGADQLQYFSIGIVLSGMFGFFRWLSSDALITFQARTESTGGSTTQAGRLWGMCGHILWEDFASSRHSRGQAHSVAMFFSTSREECFSLFHPKLLEGVRARGGRSCGLKKGSEKDKKRKGEKEKKRKRGKTSINHNEKGSMI